LSDIPTEYKIRLDLHEQIAQIDRMREETLKFTAEQHKLTALAAKLGRDRLLAPWLAIVGLIGGIITVASAIAHWKSWG